MGGSSITDLAEGFLKAHSDMKLTRQQVHGKDRVSKIKSFCRFTAAGGANFLFSFSLLSCLLHSALQTENWHYDVSPAKHVNEKKATAKVRVKIVQWLYVL